MGIGFFFLASPYFEWAVHSLKLSPSYWAGGLIKGFSHGGEIVSLISTNSPERSRLARCFFLDNSGPIWSVRGDIIGVGVESTRGHGKYAIAKAGQRGGPIFLMVVVVVYGLEEWRHLSLKILLFSEVVFKAH